jgi:hypothetical protein
MANAPPVGLNVRLPPGFEQGPARNEALRRLLRGI